MLFQRQIEATPAQLQKIRALLHNYQTRVALAEMVMARWRAVLDSMQMPDLDASSASIALHSVQVCGG
jgi:hypothetical protein